MHSNLLSSVHDFEKHFALRAKHASGHCPAPRTECSPKQMHRIRKMSWLFTLHPVRLAIKNLVKTSDENRVSSRLVLFSSQPLSQDSMISVSSHVVSLAYGFSDLTSLNGLYLVIVLLRHSTRRDLSLTCR